MKQLRNSDDHQGKSLRQHSRDGFTVIETIIVLAIAGLILFMVLIAIPALQRSSRNNQRRQDVQSVLGAVSHWELNNSGNVPPSDDNTYLQADHVKLSYYDANAPSNVHIEGGNSGWSPHDKGFPNPVTDTNELYVYNYQKCNADASGSSTAIGAGYSDVVALYAIESGGGATSKCQQI